ncbi:MAG: DUF2062 domain-containing protein [Hydrogenophaga sp.]|nr:DUF2062 domain-containing protein [Hydrogenophaga sp.]
MKDRLRAWLPSPETIRSNRWLRWLRPLLHQPRLWHFSRRGIAMGLGIGVFFGFLVPVAQIPFAAAAAVIARANLPVAVGSTLVTNPVTFGPVYYGAYRLGKALLGEEPVSHQDAARELDHVQNLPTQGGASGQLRLWLERIGAVGKPLFLGLAVVACVSGLAAYALASAAWVARTRWQRKRRLRQRALRGNRPLQ